MIQEMVKEEMIQEMINTVNMKSYTDAEQNTMTPSAPPSVTPVTKGEFIPERRKKNMKTSCRNFIKLHSHMDNETLVIRKELIISAEREGGNSTLLHYKSDMDMTDDVDVSETPEKIFSACGKDFVKLHTQKDNWIICINTGCIDTVTKEEFGSCVKLFNGDEKSVNESPERIFSMLCNIEQL